MAAEETSDTTSDVPAVREAAKWLLTALAALGSIIVGGLQFSSIGELNGAAFLQACSGFALSLTGIGLAIWFTSTVLVTRVASLTSLSSDPAAQRFLGEHPDIVGREFQSLDDFIAQRDDAWRVGNQVREGRPQGLTDAEWAGLIRQRDRLPHLELIATRIARFWRFERVCQAFVNARTATFFGTVAAAVGITLFADAVGSREPTPYADQPTAVAVSYRLGDAAYQSLLKHVSSGCLTQVGNATLLDGWPDGKDILVTARAAVCPPLRLQWNEKLGSLQIRR